MEYIWTIVILLKLHSFLVRPSIVAISTTSFTLNLISFALLWIHRSLRWPTCLCYLDGLTTISMMLSTYRLILIIGKKNSSSSIAEVVGVEVVIGEERQRIGAWNISNLPSSTTTRPGLEVKVVGRQRMGVEQTRDRAKILDRHLARFLLELL